MNAKLIAQVDTQRHKVVVDTYSAPWNELLGQYAKGDLIIDPNYQRAFRWTMEQQTKFVESLLLNIPTPPLFLAERDDGKFEIIDGLQRFSTLVKFFEGASRSRDSSRIGSGESLDNDIAIASALTVAPILPSLHGLTRITMPETLVRTLRYSRVHIILLKKESSELARYHVFTRLNRAGSSLSNQEIRNCSARMVNSRFADRLMALGNAIEVTESLRLPPGEAKAMGAQESILRLIAFSHMKPSTQRIEEFLDGAMFSVSSGEVPFTTRTESAVRRTFELIHGIFPNGEAFRFYKNDRFAGSFSTNLFDIVACGIYLNLGKLTKLTDKAVANRIVRLHGQSEIAELTGAGSNTKAKMIGRPAFGKKWFS